MTITELEQHSGVNRSTIHYYIRCGLLHEPSRTSQTMATYDKSHLRKLELIQKIKAKFMKIFSIKRVPLDYIKTKLEEECDEASQQPIVRTYTGQKITDQKKRKKEEIIKAALQLYAKKGFYRTDIRDITKKANISASTLYHYFPDKRDLFVAAINHVINEWHEQEALALEQEPHPARKTVIMVQTFQENYPKIGEILNHLRASAVTGDKWAKERLKQVYDVLMEHILILVAEGMEKGNLRQVDPRLLSFFVFMHNEAAFQVMTISDRYSAEELRSFVVEMFVFGFMTSKGRRNLNRYRKTIQQKKDIS